MINCLLCSFGSSLNALVGNKTVELHRQLDIITCEKIVQNILVEAVTLRVLAVPSDTVHHKFFMRAQIIQVHYEHSGIKVIFVANQILVQQIFSCCLKSFMSISIRFTFGDGGKSFVAEVNPQLSYVEIDD